MRRIVIILFLLVLYLFSYSQLPDISKVEYFFNTDPGLGNGTEFTFTPDSSITINEKINVSGLSKGLNTIFFRSQDENGLWSHTYSRKLYCVKLLNPELTEYEYFIDIDPGFENGIKVEIDTTEYHDTTIIIDISGLEAGIHKIFFRAKDNAGFWSHTFSRTVYVVQLLQPELTGYEYFIDTDPGFGNATQVSFDTSVYHDTTIIIDISGLEPGIHKIFFRAKDNAAHYGHTFSRTIYVVQPLNPKITEYEYFFDVDTGFMTGTIVKIDTTDNFSGTVMLDISNLTDGTHNLFIRAKDDNKNWSLTYSYQFTSVTILIEPDITYIEYYFDDDPGFGNGNPISFAPDSLLFIQTYIDISSLENGIHTLAIRARDENGKYSLTNSKIFYVIQTETESNIVGLEYSVDTDPGFGNGTFISVPNELNVINKFAIELTGLKTGLHDVFIRAQNENGAWSHTTKNSFLVVNVLNEPPKIVEVEYFVDVDPGYGNGFKIAIDSTELLDTSILLNIDSAANNTFHNLFIRARDEHGSWSITAIKEFTYRQLIEQNITLSAGWNIISFYVEPLDTQMIDIIQPLINDSTFVKMQDETGKAIEPINDTIFNNIEIVFNTEGYKINVNKDDTLNVKGYHVLLPLTIPLEQGWNIIGYPSEKSQPMDEALTSMPYSYRLQKIQDERGAAYEYVNPIGWVDNIHEFYPGEGYKVKVSYPTSISFSRNYYKSVGIINNVEDNTTLHFTPSWTGKGTEHMNIYVSEISINGQPLEPGDELAVYDGNNCVGITKINDATNPIISLVATADDPTTEMKDGFRNGNNISYKIWDTSEGTEISNLTAEYHIQYSDNFVQQGTAVVKLSANNNSTNIVNKNYKTYLGINYPNPVINETTIEFELANAGYVELKIYDITGNLITILVNENLTAGYYTIKWNRTNKHLMAVPSGIYMYELTMAGFSSINKMIVK